MFLKFFSVCLHFCTFVWVKSVWFSTFFSIIAMDTVRTLNDLSDLKETRFGQPPPRHGLNLLWWFAHDCVQIDFNGRMTAQCNPTNGAFGFHRFHNRDGLLPYSDLLYYEVGNLNTTDSLPDYVTENYTGYSDNSNKDRIIVSFDPRRRRFENIYVTQHSDQVNFDQNHTYRISAELIKDIQELSRKEFLREHTNRSEHVSIDIYQSAQTNSCQSISNELIQDIQDLIWEEILREHSDHSIDIPQSVQHNQTNTSQREKCCCVLLCCSLLLLLLIIAGTVYLLLKMKI